MAPAKPSPAPSPTPTTPLPVSTFPPAQQQQQHAPSTQVQAQQVQAAPPAFPQLVLPFLPILALALLFLFFFRLLLRQCRHCLFLRLQMASARQSQATQQSNISGRRSMELPTNSDVNEITPWSGSEPCSPPPLFLIHPAELYFPGQPFIDPSAAAFWLDHRQLVQMLGPMPPKYEDAIKLQAPARLQPLNIPSLRSRMQLQQPSDASPPPCYELASQMPMQSAQLQRETLPRLAQPTVPLPPRAARQQEHPPTYTGHLLTSSAEDLPTVVVSNAASSGSGPARASSLPPPEDRPCSSCSFGSLQEPASRKKALGTFVAKLSSARQPRGSLEKENSEE